METLARGSTPLHISGLQQDLTQDKPVGHYSSVTNIVPFHTDQDQGTQSQMLSSQFCSDEGNVEPETTLLTSTIVGFVHWRAEEQVRDVYVVRFSLVALLDKYVQVRAVTKLI